MINRKLKNRVAELERLTHSLADKVIEYQKAMGGIQRRVSTLKEDYYQMELMNHSLSEQNRQQLEEMAEIKERYNAMSSEFDSIVINIRNNNEILKKSLDSNEVIDLKLLNLTKQVKSLENLGHGAVNHKVSKSNSETQNESAELKSAEVLQSDSAATYGHIDYFDFENHFRGTREDVKTLQEQYLKYFERCNNVLDLGCGRGEFLELLDENDIPVTGVDFYQEFVDYCNMKGLNAQCADAIKYLQGCEPVDGIFGGQIAEHLSNDQLLDLCFLAYDKLQEGGCLILETPNPRSLAIYTHAFYMDPSHMKPVHPYTLKYYLQKAGFKEIEIIYTQSSKLAAEIPALESDNIKNIEEFNKIMAVVSDTMFGSQDYAIIARR